MTDKSSFDITHSSLDICYSSSVTPHSTLHVPSHMDIINKFENHVSEFLNNYVKGAALLAAVSGGADSMALLVSLCALKNSGIINKDALLCVHVEHGLRPVQESCGDACYVSDYCKSNEIQCRIKHIPPGKISLFSQRKGTGIEAAARFFRHKALFREAKRLESLNNIGAKTCILLAHTKDDLLETTLMRILRGAGPAGLSAMSRDRGSWTKDHGVIIERPLLNMAREDVINYLTAKNISWREDSTNNDEKFLRNRIRRRLIPFLINSFPSWKKGVSGLNETQSLAADFIADETRSRIKWETYPKSSHKGAEPPVRETHRGEDFFTLKYADSNHRFGHEKKELFTNEEDFFAQPQIIREEAVFSAINSLVFSVLCDSLSNKSIKRSVVRRFCEGMINAADLGPVRIMRKDGKILLSHKQKEFFECGFSHLINES